jgi:hypothetical protein
MPSRATGFSELLIRENENDSKPRDEGVAAPGKWPIVLVLLIVIVIDSASFSFFFLFLFLRIGKPIA